MSTYVELYGIELDRELGSSDTTQLFTVLRRKAATNAGQLEFVRRSECMVRLVSVSLADGTQEYDLEPLIADFGFISKQGVSIQIVSGSNTRYIEGKDLIATSVETLNDEQPGWRAVSAGTPTHRYLRADGGSHYLGFHPAPNITGSDVWTALVPCVIQPAAMSLDADEPFTYSSNVLQRLRWYHRAIAHWAAHDLEKLRKDLARSAAQFQLFESYVAQYWADSRPRGPRVVRLAMDYRAQVRRGSRPLDPRID